MTLLKLEVLFLIGSHLPELMEGTAFRFSLNFGIIYRRARATGINRAIQLKKSMKLPFCA